MNSTRYAVAGIAALVLATGGYMIGNSSSDDSQAATNAAQTQVPRNGQAPPGFGTPATGTAAKKAKAAALARYPGTAEKVMQVGNGTYLVHVITSKGEYHVAVSKAFKVTGADQGGPRGRGGMPGSTS